MPITINGSGTITGLSAGGLPDGVITAADLDGAQNGSAPIYAARAWVNFNGTGTVAIRASGNVSSITDNGTGDYTVNFTTAMSDANYSAICSPLDWSTMGPDPASFTYSTSAVRVLVRNPTTAVAFDRAYCAVAIFR